MVESFRGSLAFAPSRRADRTLDSRRCHQVFKAPYLQ